jgi:DNA-binding NarL/FixJ family response regulator
MKSPPSFGRTKVIAAGRRAGISAMLSAALQSGHETDVVEVSCIDALVAALRTNADAALVVLDFALLDETGLAALANLRARYPSIGIAILSAADATTVRSVPAAANHDAVAPGLVQLREPIGALVGHLLAVDRAPPPSEASNGGDPAQDAAGLTAQQRRVLMCLSNGLTNKTIAQSLGVTEATIKAHVTVILRKLGLECRTQAALFAQRMLGTTAMETIAQKAQGWKRGADTHALAESDSESPRYPRRYPRNGRIGCRR